MKILKNPMFYLFSLFMTDYALTYYGIRAGLIAEGNPLWVAILNLPLYLGLPFRLLYFAMIAYLPMTIIKKNPDKCRPSLVKAFYTIALGANVIILGMHAYWIIGYKLLDVLYPI
jgi:hypothetical protein